MRRNYDNGTAVFLLGKRLTLTLTPAADKITNGIPFSTFGVIAVVPSFSPNSDDTLPTLRVQVLTSGGGGPGLLVPGNSAARNPFGPHRCGADEGKLAALWGPYSSFWPWSPASVSLLLSTSPLGVPASCGTRRDSPGEFLAEESEPEAGKVHAGYVMMCDNDPHEDILKGWHGGGGRSQRLRARGVGVPPSLRVSAARPRRPSSWHHFPPKIPSLL